MGEDSHMHMKRWLTGIIAVPLLIGLIWARPRWPFYSLLFIVSLAGLMEFYEMTGSELSRFVRYSNYFLTLLLYLLFTMKQLLFAPVIIVLWALVPMTFYMLNRPSPDKGWTADIGRAILGPIYIGLPLAMLIMIDMRPEGKIWIFFLLSVIFANDTGAFYLGRLFGKHKLYEVVSPNKTWEGAVGGLISSFIVSMVFLNISNVHVLDLNILILVFALSLTAQIGDLVESMLKRNHGIKDSGKILPGHGGILDRVDGLLFSIPILYVYLVWTI